MGSKGRGGITEKQKRFAQEYLIDVNGRKAAERAGYAPRAAKVQAVRLLTNDNVKQYLAILRNSQIARTEIKSDRVLRELAALAFSDIGNLYDENGMFKPVKDLTPETAASVSSIKTRLYVEGAGENAKRVEVMEVKLWDKVSALDKLARHLGLFSEKSDTEINPNFAKMSDEDLTRFIEDALQEGVLILANRNKNSPA